MQVTYAALIKAKAFNYKSNEEDIRIIDEHADNILEFYDVISMELASQYQKKYAEFLENRSLYEAKQCSYCGGELIQNPLYTYIYECEHRNSIAGNHIRLLENQCKYMKRVEIPENNLLTAILKRTGLTGKVRHNVLYSFLKSRGREDLHVKYGYTSLYSKINGFKNAKQRSLEQEQKALEYLQTKFKIVIPQQNIEYRLAGEKTKFCIPDFICSNDDAVVVVDAKLSHIDNAKMDLYTELIRYILGYKNDNRTVKGAFIVYSEDAQYLKSDKYETYVLDTTA